MLIVMDRDATEAQIQGVVAKIESLGFEAQPMPGGERVAVAVLRNPGPVDPAHFVDLPGVIQAIPVSRPYKLVSREMKREDTIIHLPGLDVGHGHFVVIAGPCAVAHPAPGRAAQRPGRSAQSRVYPGPGTFAPPGGGSY
jgi:3-deoxy-7-phosphoheptulonate synthase